MLKTNPLILESKPIVAPTNPTLPPRPSSVTPTTAVGTEPLSHSKSSKKDDKRKRSVSVATEVTDPPVPINRGLSRPVNPHSRNSTSAPNSLRHPEKSVEKKSNSLRPVHLSASAENPSISNASTDLSLPLSQLSLAERERELGKKFTLLVRKGCLRTLKVNILGTDDFPYKVKLRATTIQELKEKLRKRFDVTSRSKIVY